MQVSPRIETDTGRGISNISKYSNALNATGGFQLGKSNKNSSLTGNNNSKRISERSSLLDTKTFQKSIKTRHNPSFYMAMTGEVTPPRRRISLQKEFIGSKSRITVDHQSGNSRDLPPSVLQSLESYGKM